MGIQTMSEDDSSTYCSRETGASTPDTPPPPRGAVAVQDQVSPVMVLPSLAPSPHSNRFHDVTQDRVEGASVEEIFECVNDSVPAPTVRVLGDEFSTFDQKHERSNKTSDSNVAGRSKPLNGKGDTLPTSAEVEKPFEINKHAVGNISSVVAVDDDDRASSIKFTFVDGESVLSRSPTTTSIVFEVEPSSNMRGTSASSLLSPNRSKLSTDTADGAPLNSCRPAEAVRHGTPASSGLANERRRAGSATPIKRSSVKSCFFEHEVQEQRGLRGNRCSSASSLDSRRGPGGRHSSRSRRSGSGSVTPLSGRREGIRGTSRTDGGRRSYGSHRSEGRYTNSDASSYSRGRAGDWKPRYYNNEPPSSNTGSRRPSPHTQHDTPHSQRSRCLLTSPRYSDLTVSQHYLMGTNPNVSHATSPALEMFKVHRSSCSPMRVRQKKRQELLAKIEKELTALRDEMQSLDMELEQAMLSDPHVRLYHMNNRRDRDERRSRLLLYLNLENARNQLLSEDDETEERRLRRRREVERKRSELFERLHQQSSARRHSSQGSTPRRRRTPSSSFDDGLHERLYSDAAKFREWHEERRQRARQEREQMELEELLFTRVLRKVGLDSSERMLTPQEEEECAAVLCTKLLDDPEKLQEYIRPKRLNREQEELLNARLARRSEINLNAIRNQMEVAQMAECTFRPRTNSPQSRNRQEAILSINKPTAASIRRRKANVESGSSTRPPSRRGHSIPRNRTCEKLYNSAKKSEDRLSALKVSSESMKKLQLLKSKLKEDHHFRRRAELDPSLAQRYMDSLVV
ncbi:hypothetical protein DPX39_100064500 [Trypanosoma brucei equiperdum]|uniref:Uncharacterized protein n=1 Tax=Trypanosoma brucei equiperdum TaxID=630700 RepID=A0A3L6L191_9TRYP|nr:hypothetical protein DPX39_100064500 [Trypanosoma brucei equiperdum]